MSSFLSLLSDELVLYMCHFINPLDLLSFQATSQAFRRLLDDEALWKQHAESLKTEFSPRPIFDLSAMSISELQRVAVVPTMVVRSLPLQVGENQGMRRIARRFSDSRFVISDGHPKFSRLMSVQLLLGGQFLLGAGPSFFLVWKLPIGPKLAGELGPQIVAESGGLEGDFTTATWPFTPPDGNVIHINVLGPTTLTTFHLDPKELTSDSNLGFPRGLHPKIVIDTKMAFEPVNRWPAQNYGRFMAWTIAPVDAQNVLLVICDTVLGRRSKVILKGVWEGHLQTLHFCGLFLIVRHAYPQFPNVLSTFDLSALTVPPKGNDVQELQPNHQLNLDSLAEGGASVWKYSIHVISNTFVAAIGRSSGTQTNGSPIPLNITACIFSVQLSGALIPYGTVPFNAIADGYYNGQTDGVHYENMTVDSSQDIHFAWTGKEGEVCWGIISSQKEADTLRLDYRYDWHLSKDYPENSSSASACALSRRTARVVSKTADEVALFVDIHDFPNRAVVAR